MSDDELKISLDSSEADKSVDNLEKKVDKTIDAVDKLNQQLRKKSPKKKIEVKLKKEDLKKVSDLHKSVKELPKKKTVKVQVDVDEKDLQKISGIQKTLDTITKQTKEQEQAVKSLDQDDKAKKYAGVTDDLTSKSVFNRIENENRAYGRQAIKIEQINRLLLQQKMIEGSISKERSREIQRAILESRQDRNKSLGQTFSHALVSDKRYQKVSYSGTTDSIRKSSSMRALDRSVEQARLKKSDDLTDSLRQFIFETKDINRDSSNYIKKLGEYNAMFGIGNSKAAGIKRNEIGSIVDRNKDTELTKSINNFFKRGETPAKPKIYLDMPKVQVPQKVQEKVLDVKLPSDYNIKDGVQPPLELKKRSHLGDSDLLLSQFKEPIKEIDLGLIKKEIQDVKITSDNIPKSVNNYVDSVIQKQTADLKEIERRTGKVADTSIPTDRKTGRYYNDNDLILDLPKKREIPKDKILLTDQDTLQGAKKIAVADAKYLKSSKQAKNLIDKTIEDLRREITETDFIDQKFEKLSLEQKNQKFIEGSAPSYYRRGETRYSTAESEEPQPWRKTGKFGRAKKLINQDYRINKNQFDKYKDGLKEWGIPLENRIEKLGKNITAKQIDNIVAGEKRDGIITSPYQEDKLRKYAAGDKDWELSLEDKINSYNKFVKHMTSGSGKIAKSQEQIATYRKEQLDLLEEVIRKEKEAGNLTFKHDEDKFRKEGVGDIDKALVQQNKYLQESVNANATLQKSFKDQTDNIDKEIKIHDEFIEKLKKNQKDSADLYLKYFKVPVDKDKSKTPGANAARKNYENIGAEIKALKESRKILGDKVKTTREYLDLVKKTGIEFNRIKHIRDNHSDILKAMGNDYKKVHTDLYNLGDTKGISPGIGKIQPPRSNVGFRSTGGKSDVIQQLPQNKLLGRFAQFGMMASGLAATIFVTQMIGAQLYNLMEIIINWENAILGVIDSIKLSSKEMDELPKTIREYSRNLGINQSKTSAAFEASLKYNIGGSQQDVKGMYALNYSDNVKDYEQAALITRVAQQDSTIAGLQQQYGQKYQRYSGEAEGQTSAAFGYEWDNLKGAAGEGIIEIWSKEDTKYGERIKNTMRDISNWITQNRATVGDWADNIVAGFKVMLKWMKMTLPAILTFTAAFAGWHGGKMFITILRGISKAIGKIVGLAPAILSFSGIISGLGVAITTLGPAILAGFGITAIFKATMAVRGYYKEIEYLKKLREQSPESLDKMTHAELDTDIAKNKAQVKKYEKELNDVQKTRERFEFDNASTNKFKIHNPGYDLQIQRYLDQEKKLQDDLKLTRSKLLEKESFEGQKYIKGWEATELIPTWNEFVSILEKANEQFTFMSNKLFIINSEKIRMDFEKNSVASGLPVASLQQEISKFDLELDRDAEAQTTYDRAATIAEDESRGWDQYEKKMYKIQQVIAGSKQELKDLKVLIIDSAPGIVQFKAYERMAEVIGAITAAGKEMQGLNFLHVQSEFDKLTKAITKLDDAIDDLGKGSVTKTLDALKLSLQKPDNLDERIDQYNKTAELNRKKTAQEFSSRIGDSTSIKGQLQDLRNQYSVARKVVTPAGLKAETTYTPTDPAYDYKKAFLDYRLRENRLKREGLEFKESPGSWKKQGVNKYDKTMSKILLDYEQSVATNKVLYAGVKPLTATAPTNIIDPQGVTKQGTVIKVIDADTVMTQWEDGMSSIVRLIGMDAYEKDTAEGMAATLLARQELLGETFQFEATKGEGEKGDFGRDLYDLILESGETWTNRALGMGAGVAKDYGQETYRSEANREAAQFAVQQDQTRRMLKENPAMLRTEREKEAKVVKDLTNRLIVLNGIWKRQGAIIEKLGADAPAYTESLKDRIIAEARLKKKGADPKLIAKETLLERTMVDMKALQTKQQNALGAESQQYGDTPKVKALNVAIKKFVVDILLQAIKKETGTSISLNDKEIEDLIHRMMNTGQSDLDLWNKTYTDLSQQESFDSRFGLGFSESQEIKSHRVIAQDSETLMKRGIDPSGFQSDELFKNTQKKIEGLKVAWDDYYSRTSNMMEGHYENEKAIIENSYQNNVRANNGISESMAKLIKQEQLYQLELKNRRALTMGGDLSVGVIEGLRKLQGEYVTTGEILESSMVSGVDGLADAMHSIIMGTDSIKDAFKSMAYSAVNDIYKIIIKQEILTALMGKDYASGKPGAQLGGIFEYFNMGKVLGKTRTDQETQENKSVASVVFDTPTIQEDLFDLSPAKWGGQSDQENNSLMSPIIDAITGDKQTSASQCCCCARTGGDSIAPTLFDSMTQETQTTDQIEAANKATEQTGMFSKMFNSMKTGLTKTFESVGNLFKGDGILGGLFNSMKSGFGKMFEGISQMFKSSGGSSGGGGGGFWGTLISGIGSMIFGSAHGNVVSGISAYSNQIVSQPTFVSGASRFSKYATGGALFGEAGPEAIMPLTRMSSGDLGVNVQSSQSATPNIKIEVINNGEPVQAEATEPKWDGKQFVLGVILDATQRNEGGFRNNMKGMLR